MATVDAGPVQPPTAGEPQFLCCPKCSARLQPAFHGPVEIDRCVGCGGIFLDRGELDEITWAERCRVLGQILGRRRSR
jgi:Zn-finger nucleic acid-binding protein